VTGTVTSVGEDGGETCIPTEGCHDESNGTGPSNSSANSGPEANDGSGEAPEESGCGCRGGGQGSPFALLVLLAGRRRRVGSRLVFRTGLKGQLQRWRSVAARSAAAMPGSKAE
jgi:hypothetical protein